MSCACHTWSVTWISCGKNWVDLWALLACGTMLMPRATWHLKVIQPASPCINMIQNMMGFWTAGVNWHQWFVSFPSAKSWTWGSGFYRVLLGSTNTPEKKSVHLCTPDVVISGVHHHQLKKSSPVAGVRLPMHQLWSPSWSVAWASQSTAQAPTVKLSQGQRRSWQIPYDTNIFFH